MSISQKIAQVGLRRISTTSARQAQGGNVSPGYFQLKKVQERFQKPDGKPVFLKGGTADGIMYRLTMGLSLVGIGGILKLIYDLANPRPIE